MSWPLTWKTPTGRPLPKGRGKRRPKPGPWNRSRTGTGSPRISSGPAGAPPSQERRNNWMPRKPLSERRAAGGPLPRTSFRTSGSQPAA